MALAYVVFFLVMMASAFCQLDQQPDRIDMNCDPRVDHRFQECPAGYCCVRDEFLPSWVYCNKLGSLSGDCTTKDIESNCPCGAALTCKPNIVSHSGVASLYGRCVNDPSAVNATTATTHDHGHHHNATHHSNGHHHHSTTDPIIAIG